MQSFRQALHTQRWDDHRYYHHSRINQSLHLLSERNLIQWHADTTNQEYLRQLSGAPQEPAFRFLTNAYEMVWYGDFELSESSFRVLHERFLNFFKMPGT